MQEDLQKYYENRWEMMATQGWQDLIEDAQKVFDQYNKVTSVDATHSVEFRKGQIDILAWLLTLKQVSEQTYEELLSEDTV